jgi:hypothetical protein
LREPSSEFEEFDMNRDVAPSDRASLLELRAGCTALLLALAWTIAAPASAQTLSGYGTAVIDGVIENQEWVDAGAALFLVNEPGGESALAGIYVMNDATNLYVGFTIGYKEDLIDASLQFDASGDGETLTAGDDAIGFTTTSGVVRDLYYGSSPDFDTNQGGTLDVVGATSTTELTTQIEISHPLDGSDAVHDIAVAPGELLPFYATIRLFPCCTDSFYPGPAAGIEAQIQIAPEATSGAAAALAGLLGLARARRHRSSRNDQGEDR